MSRFGPIGPLVPAALKVWQLPQPLARKTAFPFAALPAVGAVAGAVLAWGVVCVTLGVAAVVVAALVPADVAVAETVTV